MNIRMMQVETFKACSCCSNARGGKQQVGNLQASGGLPALDDVTCCGTVDMNVQRAKAICGQLMQVCCSLLALHFFTGLGVCFLACWHVYRSAIRMHECIHAFMCVCFHWASALTLRQVCLG